MLGDYEDFDYVERQFETVLLQGRVIVEHDDDVAVADAEKYVAAKIYLVGGEIVEVVVVDVDEEFVGVDENVVIGVDVVVVIVVGGMEEKVLQNDSAEAAESEVGVADGFAEVDQVVEDVSCNRKLAKHLLQTFL